MDISTIVSRLKNNYYRQTQVQSIPSLNLIIADFEFSKGSGIGYETDCQQCLCL